MLTFATQQARAQQNEFPECEGLKGSMLGLCRAGVKVGCFGDEINPPGCDDLSATYKAITGETAPWEAEAVCPLADLDGVLSTMKVDNPYNIDIFINDAGTLKIGYANSENMDFELIYHFDSGFLEGEWDNFTTGEEGYWSVLATPEEADACFSSVSNLTQ